jgi:hypothetical protein
MTSSPSDIPRTVHNVDGVAHSHLTGKSHLVGTGYPQVRLGRVVLVMKHAFDHSSLDRADTWTAPDVTVDDLNAYARTGRRLGFNWWQRTLLRATARVLDRFDRSHR